MKTMRIVRVALLTAIALLLLTTVTLGDTWERRTVITVQDTLNVARTAIPIIIDIEGDNLIDAGFVNANATDTRLLEALTERNFLICDNKTLLFIPSLSASQEKEFKLYTGYLPVANSFSVITGEDGYITITDHANLELWNNFSIEIEGYIDMAQPSDIVCKSSSFNLSSASGNLSVNIFVDYYYYHESVYEDDWVVGYSNSGGTQSKESNYLYLTATDTGSERTWVTDSAVNLTGIGTIYVDWENTGYAHTAQKSYLLASTSKTGSHTTYDEGEQTDGQFSRTTENFDVSGLSGNYYIRAHAYASDIYDAELKVYNVWGKQSSGGIELIASGLSSGEYPINIWADGTDFGIDVDGVTEDSTALGGASVVANSNDWIISIPYFNCYNHTVGVNHRIRYEPDAMIEETTLPNEESPGTYDGTITWGTFASNVTVTIGTTTTYAETTATLTTPSAGGGTDMVPRLPEPDEWYPSGDDLVNLPAYSQFNDAAAEMGMPVQTLYLFAIIGLAVAVGLGTALFTGSPLVSAIATGTFLAICVGTTVIGWWMVFVFIILGAGILYLTRTA